MEVTIRQVKRSDLNACYNVESQCYTSEGATRKRIEKRIKIFPKGFLVAESESKIIGIINGTSTNKDDISDEALKDMVDFDANGKNIVIFSLAVLPEYQGKGVAKRLLNKFIDVCKHLKKEKILLICKKNLIKMYEKFGFKLICKSKSEHGGFEWYEMSLQLN